MNKNLQLQAQNKLLSYFFQNQLFIVLSSRLIDHWDTAPEFIYVAQVFHKFEQNRIRCIGYTDFHFLHCNSIRQSARASDFETVIE